MSKKKKTPYYFRLHSLKNLYINAYKIKYYRDIHALNVNAIVVAIQTQWPGVEK